MPKELKKTIAFLFFMLAGVTIGSVVAHFAQNISWLSWLAMGAHSVGISTDAPVVLDLVVFKLAFGFTLDVSIAQLIFVVIAIIVYNNTCKSI